MGTGSSPGVKRPGHRDDLPPPSSTEVEGRVELYIYSPSGLLWAVPLPLHYTYFKPILPYAEETRIFSMKELNENKEDSIQFLSTMENFKVGHPCCASRQMVT
jgi:hypothetical protein